MTFRPEIAAAISSAANRNGLDSCLLASLCFQESSGNPFATRYEPAYRYLWSTRANTPYRIATAGLSPSLPPIDFYGVGNCSPQTEWVSQKTSWGLGQTMGGVARELGFTGEFLSSLTDPDTGAEFAAKKLASLLKKMEPELAVSAYNSGVPTQSNYATYVQPILQRSETYRREGF